MPPLSANIRVSEQCLTKHNQQYKTRKDPSTCFDVERNRLNPPSTCSMKTQNNYTLGILFFSKANGPFKSPNHWPCLPRPCPSLYPIFCSKAKPLFWVLMELCSAASRLSRSCSLKLFCRFCVFFSFCTASFLKASFTRFTIGTPGRTSELYMCESVKTTQCLI